MHGLLQEGIFSLYTTHSTNMYSFRAKLMRFIHNASGFLPLLVNAGRALLTTVHPVSTRCLQESVGRLFGKSPKLILRQTRHENILKTFTCLTVELARCWHELVMMLPGLGFACLPRYGFTRQLQSPPELQLLTPTISLTARTKPPTLGRREDAPSLTPSGRQGRQASPRPHHQQMFTHLPSKLQQVPILPFTSPIMSQFLFSFCRDTL